MSVSILLIPAAIAAAAAISSAVDKSVKPGTGAGTKEKAQLPQVQVRTRMRDLRLLQAALADAKARVLSATESEIRAAWSDATAAFRRDQEGIWQVHFTGEHIDRRQAEDIIRAIDAAYARHVQAAVVQRLRERAGAAGMELASETVEEDQSVTMVLNVRR